MTASSTSPVDVDAFAGAIPVAVRDTIAGSGWGAATTAAEQLALAEAADESQPELAGWLVGMTLFRDFHRRLLGKLERAPALIPHALEALAAGAFDVTGPRKLWSTIERLVMQAHEVPDELVACLPRAVMLNVYTREIAARIASAIPAQSRPALGWACRAMPYGKKRFEAILATFPTTASPAEELLARAIAAWRRSRALELEDPITLLGGAVARVRGPLHDPERRYERRQAWLPEEDWLALARRDDPADLDRLLDAPWSLDADALRLRLAALATRAPDPRIARLSSVSPVCGWIYPPVAAALDRVLAASASDERAAADPRLVDELVRATRGLARLREVLALDPSEPGYDEVLGDAYEEVGDPRGAYIAEATRRRTWTGEAPSRTVRGLLVGTLPVTTCRFARGALVGVHVESTPAELASMRESPAWRRVEMLGLDRQLYFALALERWPRVRTFETVAEDLDAFARSGPYPQLRAIGSTGLWLPDRAMFPNVAVVGSTFARAMVLTRADVERHEAAAVARGIPILVWFGTESTRLRDVLFVRTGPLVVRGTARSGFVGSRYTELDQWVFELHGDRAIAMWDAAMPLGPHALRILADPLRDAGFSRLSLVHPEVDLAPLVEVASERSLAIDFEAGPIVLDGPLPG